MAKVSAGIQEAYYCSHGVVWCGLQHLVQSGAPSSAASQECTRLKCLNQSCELPEWTQTLVSTKYSPRLQDDTLHSVTLFCSTATL